MGSALLHQTSCSLLFIVAVLLIYRGCPAEAELNMDNFACATKDSKLSAGMSYTKDGQIYIDSSAGKQSTLWDIRGFLKDGKDNKLIITVIGGASCGDSLKNVNIKQEGGGGNCRPGVASAVSSSHPVKDCPGCKSFTITCPVNMASVEGLPDARVFKVNLKELSLLSKPPCNWKGAFIDNVQFMLDNSNADNSEKCVEPGFPIMIVAIVAGVVGLLIVVAMVVGFLIYRRRQQTPPPTIELGTKTASPMEPSIAAKSEKGASMWTFWQGGAKTTKQSVLDGPKTQWQSKGSTATNMGTSKAKQSGVEMTKFGASTMKTKQSGVEVPKSSVSKSGVTMPKSVALKTVAK